MPTQRTKENALPVRISLQPTPKTPDVPQEGRDSGERSKNEILSRHARTEVGRTGFEARLRWQLQPAAFSHEAALARDDG